MTERISKTEAIEYALMRFQDQLQKRLQELQKQTLKAADAVTTLQNQRRELKGQAGNLGEAIAKIGHSATLLHRLAMIESEIEQIDERLALANQPLDLAFSLGSIRDFVCDKALDFRTAFDSEPGKARQILANHIERLALTPRVTDDGPVYDVSGDIDLFGGDREGMSLAVKASMSRPAGKKCVMQVVARDGIEPPTPAFSRPRSTVIFHFFFRYFQHVFSITPGHKSSQ